MKFPRYPVFPQRSKYQTVMEKFLEICANAFSVPHCFVCNRMGVKGNICSSCLPYEFELMLPIKNRCTACFRPLPYEAQLCPRCITSPGDFRHIRSLFIYTERVRTLVRVMKFDKIDRISVILADAMGAMLTTAFPIPDWDVVVPIPISDHRLSIRGYNQCLVIAKVVSLFKQCPMAPALKFGGGNILRIPQSLKSFQERVAILRQNPFHIKNRKAAAAVRGKSVLLIDDVLTSGATAVAAVDALLGAGAKCVDVYTLAVSLNWKGPP